MLMFRRLLRRSPEDPGVPKTAFKIGIPTKLDGASEFSGCWFDFAPEGTASRELFLCEPLNASTILEG